jgi:hypothetical protein
VATGPFNLGEDGIGAIQPIRSFTEEFHKSLLGCGDPIVLIVALLRKADICSLVTELRGWATAPAQTEDMLHLSIPLVELRATHALSGPLPQIVEILGSGVKDLRI